MSDNTAIKSIKSVIIDIVDRLKMFNQDITKDRIVSELIPWEYRKINTDDFIFKKRRGCPADNQMACCCTGRCDELVPVTELDLMINDAYLNILLETSDVIDEVMEEKL